MYILCRSAAPTYQAVFQADTPEPQADLQAYCSGLAAAHIQELPDKQAEQAAKLTAYPEIQYSQH